MKTKIQIRLLDGRKYVFEFSKRFIEIDIFAILNKLTEEGIKVSEEQIGGWGEVVNEDLQKFMEWHPRAHNPKKWN